MSLNSSGFSGLCKDGEELVIGEEIESGECCSFAIEKFIESFDNLFKIIDHELKGFSLSRLKAGIHYSGVK
jgi:hypothetical protein